MCVGEWSLVSECGGFGLQYVRRRRDIQTDRRHGDVRFTADAYLHRSGEWKRARATRVTSLLCLKSSPSSSSYFTVTRKAKSPSNRLYHKKKQQNGRKKTVRTKNVTVKNMKNTTNTTRVLWCRKPSFEEGRRHALSVLLSCFFHMRRRWFQSYPFLSILNQSVVFHMSRVLALIIILLCRWLGPVFALYYFCVVCCVLCVFVDMVRLSVPVLVTDW